MSRKFLISFDSVEEVRGIPAKLFTEIMYIVTGVFCAIGSFGFMVILFLDGERFPPSAFIIEFFLVVGLFAFSFYLLGRSGKEEINYSFVVNNDGINFSYGGKVCDIAWGDIKENVSSWYDVGTHGGRKYEPTGLEFWVGQEKHVLYFQGEFKRFKNKRELQIAVLKGLALRGLRFSPGIFLSYGIDPSTWERMNGPRFLVGCFVSLAIISIWPIIFLAVKFGLSIFFIIFAMIFVFMVSAICYVAVLKKKYPKLNDVIEFEGVKV
ncbi:hypothetical protein [Paraburkholderia adhaesiva]|uniref:hypothetical protein n=1 Tax=Paraburkholderia adhaesiva TaxID=2883244 RepID=UPI001F3F3E8C|nr:hypothetical protein [Paraburkholderia adhaesiva]